MRPAPLADLAAPTTSPQRPPSEGPSTQHMNELGGHGPRTRSGVQPSKRPTSYLVNDCIDGVPILNFKRRSGGRHTLWVYWQTWAELMHSRRDDGESVHLQFQLLDRQGLVDALLVEQEANLRFVQNLLFAVDVYDLRPHKYSNKFVRSLCEVFAAPSRFSTQVSHPLNLRGCLHLERLFFAVLSHTKIINLIIVLY